MNDLVRLDLQSKHPGDPDRTRDLPVMHVLAAQGRASFSTAQLQALSAASNLTVHRVLGRVDRQTLLALCRDAQLLGITRRAVADLDEEHLRGMPRLRGLAIYATGTDWIDLEALRRRNVALAPLPDYSTQTVAEHTLGLILTLSRRLHLSDRVARADLPASMSLRGWELAGKSIGLIGYGRIGQAVGGMATAFGMQVRYCDDKHPPSTLGIRSSFDEIVTLADVLVLTCSHRRGAAPLIDAAALARMKPGSYLINPARAALVDHAALLQALADRRLSGYAVDDKVFSPAQLATVEPGRIFQSGHTAWYSNEAMARGTQAWVNNLVRLARHRPATIVTP